MLRCNQVCSDGILTAMIPESRRIARGILESRWKVRLHLPICVSTAHFQSLYSIALPECSLDNLLVLGPARHIMLSAFVRGAA